MSAKQKSILAESKIKITSIGGDAEATLAMIRSGDWSQDFTNTAPLSSAAPMCYTFRNLSDDSIASVTETTEYNIRSCQATQPTLGTFNFLNAQNLGLHISSPVKVMVVDVNGDGNQDLIYNHVIASSNETVVAYYKSDQHANIFDLWGVFNRNNSGWQDYRVILGDMDGNAGADLVRVNTNVTQGIAIWRDMSTGSTLALQALPLQLNIGDDGELDYRSYDMRLILLDVNGDGRKDLLMNRMDAVNQSIIVQLYIG